MMAVISHNNSSHNHNNSNGLVAVKIYLKDDTGVSSFFYIILAKKQTLHYYQYL